MLARVIIVIDGKPRGKERPRMGQWGVYTPKQTEIEEAHIAQLGRKAMAGQPPCLGPVRLTFEAVFETPASWPSRAREMGNAGQLPHISTPDLDNIQKLAQDALNGIVYVDDGQICEVVSRKRYGPASRVEIIIDELATSSDHPALKRSAKRALEEKDEIRPRGRRNKPRKAAAPAVKIAPIGKRLR